MKIKIIALGRLKNSPFLLLWDDYLKRMTWNVSLTEIEAPKNASAVVEAGLIIKHLKNDSFIVALDERGESFSSAAFSQSVAKWNQQGSLVFLIGGADGFDNSIRARAKILMSFGKQTWPHMMVRVMLLEQIYRAQQIAAGHPYHRA